MYALDYSDNGCVNVIIILQILGALSSPTMISNPISCTFLMQQIVVGLKRILLTALRAEKILNVCLPLQLSSTVQV